VSRLLSVLAATMLLSACGGDDKPSPTYTQPTFDVDTDRISVSGFSSGAYMAGQLHLAYPQLFDGVAIISGGPWWCAQGSLANGLGPCINGEGLDVAPLLEHAREMEQAGSIGALADTRDDTVWIFHGPKDAVVSRAVAEAAVTFYEKLVATGRVVFVTDVPAVHGYPTLDTGRPCDEMGPPYLNACDYDASGELLAALDGKLEPRGEASGELREIRQPGADRAGMLADALLYVPAPCAAGENCGIHVALHGCQMSTEFVGDQFAAGAGYNEWAETNRLIILYPQVASSKVAPMNPLGCWDWWGYTGDDYAARTGPQISVIKATLDALAGRTL